MSETSERRDEFYECHWLAGMAESGADADPARVRERGDRRDLALIGYFDNTVETCC